MERARLSGDRERQQAGGKTEADTEREEETWRETESQKHRGGESLSVLKDLLCSTHRAPKWMGMWRWKQTDSLHTIILKGSLWNLCSCLMT